MALAVALVPWPASWVEFGYSERIYLSIQHALTSWSNACPFAVTDALLLVLVAGLVTTGVWMIRDRREVGTLQAMWRLVVRVLPVLSVVYLVFIGFWGLNYRREPLRTRLDFSRQRVTPVSARAMAEQVLSRVNALYHAARGGAAAQWDALPTVLGPAFGRVQRQLAAVDPAVPGVPKRSVLTLYLERAGVSGVTNPFALEVVVDQSLLPFERAFVAAHEWAHLAGYADESEANFVGWLTCLQGPPAAEYSGDLVLLLHLLGAVTPAERTALVQTLEKGPRDDVRAMGRREARIWPLLQRPAWWLYDRYLLANHVEQGVRSYGAALELFLGTRYASGWVPQHATGRSGAGAS
jgi:hypothetical protein